MNYAEILLEIANLRWLWDIFAGFYLVAYAFWVPALFDNPWLVVASVALTLLAGGSLLFNGFSVALVLGSVPVRVLGRRLLGGVLLLAYLLVYIPPEGRLVAHWPLDLAITAVSGTIMLCYFYIDMVRWFNPRARS